MDIDRRTIRQRWNALSNTGKAMTVIGGVLFSPLWIAVVVFFALRDCAFHFADLFDL